MCTATHSRASWRRCARTSSSVLTGGRRTAWEPWAPGNSAATSGSRRATPSRLRRWPAIPWGRGRRRPAPRAGGCARGGKHTHDARVLAPPGPRTQDADGPAGERLHVGGEHGGARHLPPLDDQATRRGAPPPPADDRFLCGGRSPLDRTVPGSDDHRLRRRPHRSEPPDLAKAVPGVRPALCPRGAAKALALGITRFHTHACGEQNANLPAYREIPFGRSDGPPA